MGLQAALRLIYPPQCLNCEALVASDFGLCAECWRDTAFVTGPVCDLCGIPVAGDGGDEVAHCDDCLMLARPWLRGRAAILYRDAGRRMVLGLKHGDRTDLARPAAGWMLRAAAPILTPGMIVAPVPLHWFRLFRRRYNQAALLSGALARLAGLAHLPDLLARSRDTRSQDGRSREGRYDNMAGAIRLRALHRDRVAGQHVLLVDDVMTSGATFAACAEACLGAGAAAVSVVALARVAKES